MHFCAQELIVLLALVDNLPITLMWFNSVKEKLLCSSHS